MFYCLVWDNGTMSAYRNSVFNDSKLLQGVHIYGNTGGISTNWWYGTERRQSAQMTGSIDEVMIFNEALSQCEIDQLYNNYSTSRSDTILSICGNQTQQLNADINAISFLWSTGANTQSISVSDSGTYYAIQYYSGGCYDTAFFHVNMKPIPVPQPPTFLNTCANQQVILNADSSANGYSWSTGENKRSIAVSDSGTYFVVQFYKSGCSDTAYYHVGSIPINLPNPNPQILNMCTNQMIVLYADSSANAYNWSTGSKSPSIVVTDSGKFSVIQYYKTGCSDTAYYQVNLIASPKLQAYTYIDNPCNYDSVLLFASNGYASYQWYRLPDNKLVSSSQTFSTQISGNYYVVGDNNNCFNNSDTILVNFSNFGNFAILGDSSFCAGDTIALSASFANAIYKWSTGDTTQTIKVFKSGIYKVLIRLSTICIDSVVINIKENKIPDLTIDSKYFNGDNCNSDSTILTASPGFATYNWYLKPNGNLVRKPTNLCFQNKWNFLS